MSIWTKLCYLLNTAKLSMVVIELYIKMDSERAEIKNRT